MYRYKYYKILIFIYYINTINIQIFVFLNIISFFSFLFIYCQLCNSLHAVVSEFDCMQLAVLESITSGNLKAV